MPDLPRSAASIRSRNKKIGLFFLLGPWIGLFLILIVWAIVSFVISSSIASAPLEQVATTTSALGSVSTITLHTQGSGVVAAQLINVALGFFGMLCMISTLPGLIIGIIFLTLKVPEDQAPPIPPSGMSPTA